MNKQKVFGLALIAVVIIAAIAGTALQSNDSNHEHHSDGSAQKSAKSSTQSSSELSAQPEDPGNGVLPQNTGATSTASTMISYTASGFSPNDITVKSGDAVTITNTAATNLYFGSGPHPAHTDQPELNAGEITPGASKVITVTKKGDWSFHNHHNETHTGVLHVQ